MVYRRQYCPDKGDAHQGNKPGLSKKLCHRVNRL